jgi:hypothetical protein
LIVAAVHRGHGCPGRPRPATRSCGRSPRTPVARPRGPCCPRPARPRTGHRAAADQPAADPGRFRNADRAHLRPHRARSQCCRDTASEDHRVRHLGGRQHRDHDIRIRDRPRRRRCHQRSGIRQRRGRGRRPVPDRGGQPRRDQVAGHRRAHDAGPQHRHPDILVTAIGSGHLSLPARSYHSPRAATPRLSWMHLPDRHSHGCPGSCRPVPVRSRRAGGNGSRPPSGHATPGHHRQPGHPGRRTRAHAGHPRAPADRPPQHSAHPALLGSRP